MADQNIRKNPLEDQIIEEIAENVASEMIAEIRDEVAVWVEKLPITSTKVRSTDITKVFQERFAHQLAVRQERIAEQIVLRQREGLEQIPTGRVRKEIIAIETQAVLDKEEDFVAHVLQCAMLASRIAIEKAAFEKEESGIAEKVEREMEVVLRQDRERWMEMSQVSYTEFEKEWEEIFGGA
jgi:hypothetical protein